MSCQLAEWINELHNYIRVIAALAHVDMVVRVNGLLRATFTAEDLDSTVRDDLLHHQYPIHSIYA